MNDESTEIQLHKSRLSVRNGILEKSDSKGRIVARHSLSHVKSARMLWKIEPANVLICVASAAGTIPAWNYIESSGWKWTSVIFLLLLSLLGAAMIQQQYLILDCGEDTVQYNLHDMRDENDGFVVSLRQMLNDKSNTSEEAAITVQSDTLAT
jgi:hypothetical protein